MESNIILYFRVISAEVQSKAQSTYSALTIFFYVLIEQIKCFLICASNLPDLLSQPFCVEVWRLEFLFKI